MDSKRIWIPVSIIVCISVSQNFSLQFFYSINWDYFLDVTLCLYLNPAPYLFLCSCGFCFFSFSFDLSSQVSSFFFSFWMFLYLLAWSSLHIFIMGISLRYQSTNIVNSQKRFDLFLQLLFYLFEYSFILLVCSMDTSLDVSCQQFFKSRPVGAPYWCEIYCGPQWEEKTLPIQEAGHPQRATKLPRGAWGSTRGCRWTAPQWLQRFLQPPREEEKG